MEGCRFIYVSKIGIDVYLYTLWLFPFTIGIAYVGAQLLDKRKLWVRAIMIAAIVVILWGTGGPVLKKYIAPSNYYKMELYTFSEPVHLF